MLHLFFRGAAALNQDALRREANQCVIPGERAPAVRGAPGHSSVLAGPGRLPTFQPVRAACLEPCTPSQALPSRPPILPTVPQASCGPTTPMAATSPALGGFAAALQHCMEQAAGLPSEGQPARYRGMTLHK